MSTSLPLFSMCGSEFDLPLSQVIDCAIEQLMPSFASQDSVSRGGGGGGGEGGKLRREEFDVEVMRAWETGTGDGQ